MELPDYCIIVSCPYILSAIKSELSGHGNLDIRLSLFLRFKVIVFFLNKRTNKDNFDSKGGLLGC